MALKKIRQRLLNISGNEIWTESLGSIKNPAVLLISGAGAHAHFWTDLFCEEIVKGGFFVIRYDHRDVGLSSGGDYQEQPYKVEDLTFDAVGVLEGYGVHKAHLVGHSMGGIIAQLFASMCTEKVLSLVSLCSGPAGATPLTDLPLTEEEQMLVDKTREINASNKPTASFEESLPGFMRMWERWNGTLPLDRELAIDFTREFFTRTRHKINVPKGHPHLRAIRVGLETMHLRRDIFKTIRAPALIIQGEEDYLLVPRRGGIALAKELPQSILKLIPKMGHMFFNKECQKLLADLIVEFFKSTEL